MDDRVKEARLLWEVGVEGIGGNELLVTDLNGDGKPELLVGQSPGQLRSDAHFSNFGPRGWYTEEERRLHCLTATDLEGNRLWQVGEPHRGEDPFCSHGMNDLVSAELDGDGLSEVLCVVWDTLTVYDGATGDVKAERKLPADNFATVRTGALKGDPDRQQVLVKVNAQSYAPYEYGNPTFVLDSDLSEMWMERHYRGSGHTPVILDIDGDGRDEILIGYNVVDPDGKVRWTIPIENATAEHADHINPVDLDGDGRVEIAYSGSKDFFVSSDRGEVLWKRPHRHSQTTIAGRFQEGGRELGLVLNEKWIGMTCYTWDGQALWTREGVGYGRHCVSGWRDDGLDLILYEPSLKVERDETPFESVPEETPMLWPVLLDGDGNVAVRLPWKDDYVQPRERIRGFRGYDYGIGFRTQVADLDGDGREEVLIYDRRRVLAFGPPG